MIKILEKPKKELCLHPDALYDAPYETNELDVSSFTPVDCETSPSIKQLTNGIEISGNQGKLRITSPDNNILRIQAVPHLSEIEKSVTEKLGLVHVPDPPSSFMYEEFEDKIKVSTAKFEFELDCISSDFTVKDAKSQILLQSKFGGINFSDQDVDHSGFRSMATFKFDKESIYGFGGRILSPKRNNTTMDVFTMKVGTTSGDYGGSPVPFFMSTKGYGFFLNNPWPHVYFDMGSSEPDEWFYHAPGGDCDIFVFAGPEFPEILKSYTSLTGRSPMPKRWWLGFWCSSLTFETTKDVLEAARRLRAEKYPCEAIVLDGPWRGGPNFVKQYSEGQEYISKDFDWHEDFGDGPAMVKELNELGFKVILHVNSRNFAPDSTKAGLEKGLLRKHGDEVVVRLLNEESEEYYESLVQPRINDGVELWWTDHADRVSGSLNEELPSRNLFGVLWNRLLVDIMEKNSNEHRPCLTRGSGIGGQRFGIPWPGDTRVGLDAFKDDIWFCLNAGLAGFSLTSTDLAGFTLSKEKEEYASEAEELEETFNDENICRRLCQSIMFIPVPRIHNNWTTAAKFPWRCSEKGEKLYQEALHFRYALTPYFYHWAIQSSITGEPILRPMVYHNRNNRECQICDDQFYVGENMIFAPVTEEGVTSKTVYLPEGTWYSWWTEEKHEGPCKIGVKAPLDELSGLPIFVKAGSVIPMQAVTDNLPDEIPEKLTLKIFPGKSSHFILKESETTDTVIDVANDKVKISNNAGIDREFTIKLPDAILTIINVPAGEKATLSLKSTENPEKICILNNNEITGI